MNITEDGIAQLSGRLQNDPLLRLLLNEIQVSKKPLVYHYSNIDALYAGIILKSPSEGKEICLRASNIAYMNDPEEMKTGLRFWHKMLNNKTSSNKLRELINKVQKHSFIISFTSQNEFLPMWSMYGRNGHGITLGFDKEILLKELSNKLYNCLYADSATLSEYKKKLASPNTSIDNKLISTNPTGWFIDVIEEGILKSLAAFVSFEPLVVLTKNPAYKYEQEIRYFELCSCEDRIKYRQASNLIIPFIEVFISKSALKEICIGPVLNFQHVKYSISEFLTSNGFAKDDVKIVKSKVPYRP